MENFVVYRVDRETGEKELLQDVSIEVVPRKTNDTKRKRAEEKIRYVESYLSETQEEEEELAQQLSDLRAKRHRAIQELDRLMVQREILERLEE